MQIGPSAWGVKGAGSAGIDGEGGAGSVSIRTTAAATMVSSSCWPGSEAPGNGAIERCISPSCSTRPDQVKPMRGPLM